ncbi:MAG TPA: 3D-(3,5/4)-trihydroxycyclohexane-1,2-dione acylhydrolase (decyclizing) [Deinococcales bacterium]|nr:3D-(3,5/4)-trihydroxycyclohexane-1,2-dione acylhydrolase (decyclizing) [Deinococcales bacterium]
MKSIRLTAAQATVRFLASQYSERDRRRQRLIRGVWSIFGHGNVAGLGQALEELGPEYQLPTYRPQNEQAMVHVAAACAKHTNRLSTFACASSIGPGATNMLTGAALATINRLPVLLIPSDYFANRIPDPVLQQLEHPTEHDVSVNDAFRPLSRFFTRVSRPEQLLSALPEAMRVLTDPAETGAVTLSFPEDVQAEAWDWPLEFFEERVWQVRRPPAEPEAVARAVELMARAERPLFVCGGGVIYSEAHEQLAAFASAYGIPVVESQAGKGAIPWDHPMNAGAIGSAGGLAANRLARDADLVIAVGTRLGDFVTASRSAFAREDVRFIGLNVTPFDAAKLSALSVVADARRGLEALDQALRSRGFTGSSDAYRGEVAAIKGEWDAIVDRYRAENIGGELAQGAVLGALNDFYGGKATMINAAGSMPGDLLRLWRPEDPKAYHVEYGYSCMGYEIPAGIGVKLAEPEREVLVLIGDGSYLMMNSEVVTAVGENLDLTIVLVDNRGYGSIRGLQMACGSPSFNNELRHRDPATGRTSGPPIELDFVKHAEGLGARAHFAPDMAALKAALAASRSERGVKVIVVPVSLTERVPGFESWWDVPIAETTAQAGVQGAREDYLRQVAAQRKHYAPSERVGEAAE